MRSELQDDPIVGPIVERFVSNLPARTAALLDAQARQDWPGVSTLAHQLSGASGGYGFPEMSIVAAAIETEANGKVDQVAVAASINKFSVLCTAALQFYARH